MFIQHDAIHVNIKTTGNYKSLTDNSKKYEDMHRRDKHRIQENVTSGEGGKRKQLEKKALTASV